MYINRCYLSYFLWMLTLFFLLEILFFFRNLAYRRRLKTLVLLNPDTKVNSIRMKKQNKCIQLESQTEKKKTEKRFIIKLALGFCLPTVLHITKSKRTFFLVFLFVLRYNINMKYISYLKSTIDNPMENIYMKNNEFERKFGDILHIRLTKLNHSMTNLWFYCQSGVEFLNKDRRK